MKITGKFVLTFLTIVLLVASIAFAIETLLIDDVKGIQLANDLACETDLEYYISNETECDGFVYWLVIFVPFWILLTVVWLFHWGKQKNHCKQRELEG